MPTGKQIRAARVLADWDAQDLAAHAGLSRISIQNIERGEARAKATTMAKIVRAFSDIGIEFLENEGVRRRPSGIQVLEGTDGFSQFYDFVYQHLTSRGGNVCVAGVDEALFAKHRLHPEAHRARMAQLAATRPDFNMRIIVQQGDRNFTANSYATYRWQQKEYFSPSAFYVFGDCLALISFAHEPSPLVVILQSAAFAKAYRHAFELAWTTALEPTLESVEKQA